VCGQVGVIVGAVAGLWVGVHERSGQPPQLVQQLVLCGDGYLMSLHRAGIRPYDDLALRPELVSDPANPDVTCVQQAGNLAQGLLGPIGDGGVDGIHQPPVDLACRPPQHNKDGQRDGTAMSPTRGSGRRQRAVAAARV
jgi:hypothetical protein